MISDDSAIARRPPTAMPGSGFEARNRYFDTLVNTPGLMWLGQNTNHFTPHPAVVEAMLKSIRDEEYHAYAPPAGLEALRQGILRDLGLPSMCALVTDGAVEALYVACRELAEPGTTFVTTDPGWKWPKGFAASVGARVVEIPIYGRERGFRLSKWQLASAVDGDTRIIYLVDPNNPLGTCHTEDEIRTFADTARRTGAWLIHDCTYRDFADHHTLAARFYPEKTITITSFSKWLGIAGLRVGALVASPNVVERLVGAAPNILGCNIVSQRAALAGLATKAEWFPAINARQRRNQAAIDEAVRKVDGLELVNYPSQANLLVMECVEAGITPEALCAAFRDERIMIRPGRYHTDAFGERFVKISTTVPEAWADAFCERLPAMVERARSIEPAGAVF